MNKRECKRIYEQAEADSVIHNNNEKKTKKVPLVKTQETLSEIKCALLIGIAREIINKSYETIMKSPNKSGLFNDSFLLGYEMIDLDKEATIDFQKVANTYSNKIDFDSFVFGIFSKLNRNAKMIIDNMNDLFYWLNLYGFTKFSSFEEYCLENEYYVVENGEKSISIAIYINGALKHLQKIEAKTMAGRD